MKTTTDEEATAADIERARKECGAPKEAFDLATVIAVFVMMAGSGSSIAKALATSARMIDEHVKREVTKHRDNAAATTTAVAWGDVPRARADFSYSTAYVADTPCNCPGCLIERTKDLR